MEPADAVAVEATGEDARLIMDLRDAFDSCGEGLSLADALAAGSATRLMHAATAASNGAAVAVGAALARGSRLGDFEILYEIGRGGMGIVYRARQASLNREVALKVLPAALRHRRSSIRRFRTEAQAVARLNHPNIVRVFAHGEHNEHLYYAMEYVDGVTLDWAICRRPDLLSSTWARRTNGDGADPPGASRDDSGASGWMASELSLPPLEHPGRRPATPQKRAPEDFRHIADLIAGAADGLAHAHAQGVIHRDVKPQNLLLGPDGRLRIVDFGLAQLTDEPNLTVTGEIMGTPAYLSPEQTRGDARDIDHRTDIYALGATLYQLITWQRPFEGATREQIIDRIRTTEPPRPRLRDASIPRDIETICLRAMDKDPARRHPSAAELADDLRRFTDGRPILSRRHGILDYTAKWIRRHKAPAVAIIATAAVVVLVAGLAATSISWRRSEGNRLLGVAYEQLAFRDYRHPEFVADTLARAARLGADETRLALARAIARLGETDQAGALEQLDVVLDDDPDDTLALYLLAWTQWRDNDRDASRATFDHADAMGGPQTAEAWFFRGIAAHFDRPALAIESYKRANDLRAEAHQFYPQAVLHLARAYNQQMYATRSIAPFADATARLEQLIQHGHYGAYPYYLLSIAHRLAGEIADGAPDLGLDPAAHWTEALTWARSGQAVDPTDNLVVTAEAECMERLGRLDDAIEARSRALELAVKPRDAWQAYHYRWRLYYWTHQLDAALDDLETLTTFDADSRFYSHVYPALVYADAGDMDAARALARDIADAAPDDAQAVLWSAACLRMLGEPDEAAALLDARADTVVFDRGLVPPQTPAWVQALYALAAHDMPFDDLVALAVGPARSKLLAEAHFHAATAALADGDRRAGLEHFRAAYLSFDSELRYTFHAGIVYNKLRDDADWPPWGPASTAEYAGSHADRGPAP